MLDLTRLKELCLEIGAEDVGFIIAVYFDEAAEVLGRIRADTAPDERARSLHFLRSGALNLGLVDFADVSTEANGKEAMQSVFAATRDAVQRLWTSGELEALDEATC